jgi:hypothetical protein
MVAETMPRGRQMFCCKYSPSRTPPLTRSIIKPAQSIEVPYAQPSPGSNRSG